MRKLILIFLSVTICSGVAFAQEMLTQGHTPFYKDPVQKLNRTRQDALSAAVLGQADNRIVAIVPNTLVNIIKKENFTRKEMVQSQESAVPNSVDVDYQAVYIEILEGLHEGEKGWAVLSYKAPGSEVHSFLYSAPPDYRQQRAAAEKVQSELEEGVDLAVDIYPGSISPTGGRFYEIGIINRGGIEAIGVFKVIVEIDGKVVQTERIRGPLESKQSLSFSVRVPEKALRERATIKATIDSGDRIKDLDQDNDTASRQLMP